MGVGCKGITGVGCMGAGTTHVVGILAGEGQGGGVWWGVQCMGQGLLGGRV